VKKKIGYRIRKIRESKDLKRETVADELGINHSSYSKIERGETDPSASRLLEIARVLKVSAADFFEDIIPAFKDDGSNYGYATKEEVESLSKAVSTLTKEIEKFSEELQKIKHPSGKKNKKSK
jgi:transcriptional regulator with XRE-family HTH domain